MPHARTRILPGFFCVMQGCRFKFGCLLVWMAPYRRRKHGGKPLMVTFGRRKMRGETHRKRRLMPALLLHAQRLPKDGILIVTKAHTLRICFTRLPHSVRRFVTFPRCFFKKPANSPPARLGGDSIHGRENLTCRLFRDVVLVSQLC